MDTDDVSLPDRFLRQINFMRTNTKIDVCGSYIEEFNSKSAKIIKYPCKDKKIKKFLKHRNPICHPVCVYRKSVLYDIGKYPNLRIGQDYALWSIMAAKGCIFYNYPKILLKFRTNDNFFQRRSWKAFQSSITVNKLQRNLNIITLEEMIRNIVFRFLLRMSPVILIKFAYKYLR